MHTAPCTPKEFFLKLPSITPKSKCIKSLLKIKLSRNYSRPSPEIILEAKLRDVSLAFLSMLIIAGTQ